MLSGDLLWATFYANEERAKAFRAGRDEIQMKPVAFLLLFKSPANPEAQNRAPPVSPPPPGE